MITAIISKQEEQKPQSLDSKSSYPVLGVNKGGRVILFTTEGSGVVVIKGEDNRPIGYSSNSWYMPYYLPYSGEVTISNAKA